MADDEKVIADPTVTIAFEGLMFFQSTGGERRQVTLVDARDHGHQPHIEIWEKAADSLTQRVFKKLQKDDIIRFNVAPDEITRTTLYQQFVPELRRFVFGGDVEKPVVHQLTHSGAIAYADLPPGCLSIFHSFPTGVRLVTSNNDPEIHCFARFVVMTTTDSPTKLTIEHRGTKESNEDYSLEPTDLVIVSNISPEHEHGNIHHFQMYEKLLSPGSTFGSIIPTKQACDDVAGDKQFRPEIEKLLANRDISFFPNGDCGPTGP